MSDGRPRAAAIAPKRTAAGLAGRRTATLWQSLLADGAVRRAPKEFGSLSRNHLSRSVAARAGGLVLLGIDPDRLLGPHDDVLVDMDLVDPVHRRQIEHGVEQDALEDRTEPARAGLPVDRLAGDRAQRVVGEAQLDLLHVEQLLVLLH